MKFIEQCQTIAKKHFSINALRPAQLDVFSLLHEHKFVLATLPTGAGKTLLYAVPAMIFDDGPVIVISPLISLMRDQARRMEQAGVPCVVFTSDQTEEERKQSNFDFWSINTKIIFISPERLVLSSFFKKLIKIKPSMIVIDEAHCVIAWGHQFRPEYSEIGRYLIQLQPNRILAITATASAVTRQEIIQKIFYQQEVSQFISKPIGKHIFVSSLRAFSFEEQKERLFDILKSSKSEKSIVYFSTRKQCEEFAGLLKEEKLNAVAYHAGLTKESRMHVETYIHKTHQKTVICATTAFGLGVDIPNVTLVVVYGFPSNIEEFLQMIGRAGRHGQPSEGILLWTGSDPAKRNYQFKELFPSSAIFLEQCQKIIKFFPTLEGEKIFVLKEQILKNFIKYRKNKNSTRELDGFLGALRICQMTEEIAPHEDYYQIKLHDKISMSSLLKTLPSTPTKRQIVLEALKNLVENKLIDVPAVNIVISSSKILNIAHLVHHKTFDEVLAYYHNQNVLSFVKFKAIQAQFGIIIKHRFEVLRKNLDKYIKAQQHFASSLQELRKLAEAPRCRLESSFRYFEVPITYGESFYCLQCDLCKHNKRI